MRSLITQTAEHGAVVLHLDGEFDLSNRAEVEAACRKLAGRPAACRTIVDLTEVSFIDCGTIRRLAGLGLARRALGDSCTTIVSSPFLHRLLDLTGYSTRIPVRFDPTVVRHSHAAAG